MDYRVALIFTCIYYVGNVMASEEPEISPGVVAENLPVPLFYETFVPVIHEYILPEWEASDMEIQWPPNHINDCGSLEQYASSSTNTRYQIPLPAYLQTCSMVANFNQIIVSYAKNITSWKDFAKIPADIEADDVSFSCEEIQPHFKTSSVSQKILQKYMTELRKCSIGYIVKKMGINQFANVSTAPYRTMLASTEYSHQSEASLINLYTSLQGMELLNFYVESNRWRNALVSCNSRQIPFDLISHQELKLILKQISDQLTTKNQYELAIPHDLSLYYKSSLADCVFTENNSVIVRVLIPIKKIRGSNYKIIKVHSIPFLKMGLTSNEPHTVCSVNADIEGHYIFERSTGVVAKTTCSKTDLCWIPSRTNLPIAKPCLSSIFANNSKHADIIENDCDVSCFPIKKESLPIFRRLSSDTYTISGKQTEDIFINCAGKPYKVISPNETGALFVKLRCDCQIIYQSEDLHATPPCGDQLVLKHIIPRFWSNGKSNNVIPLGRTKAFESDNGKKFDQIVTEMSWLTHQIFILWGVIIILIILTIVLIATNIKLGYFSRYRAENRGTPMVNENEYEVPFMLQTRGRPTGATPCSAQSP